MADTKNNLKIRSYEITLFLHLNISPVCIIRPNEALLNGKIVRFRNVEQFIKKQMKTNTEKTEDFTRLLKLLESGRVCHGLLIALRANEGYDGLYIKYAFDNIEDLNKFNSELKEELC